jgi:hypothetical protein
MRKVPLGMRAMFLVLVARVADSLTRLSTDGHPVRVVTRDG